jgi:ribosomal-protein-serine acetyltransferase
VTSLNDICIRPYRVEDASALWEAAIASQAELTPWMPWCHPKYSIEESRSWIETQVAAFEQGAAFEFVIASGNGCQLNTKA